MAYCSNNCHRHSINHPNQQLLQRLLMAFTAILKGFSTPLPNFLLNFLTLLCLGKELLKGSLGWVVGWVSEGVCEGLVEQS